MRTGLHDLNPFIQGPHIPYRNHTGNEAEQRDIHTLTTNVFSHRQKKKQDK